MIYPTQELASGTRPVAILEPANVEAFNYSCIPLLNVNAALPATDPLLVRRGRGGDLGGEGEGYKPPKLPRRTAH